MNVGDEQVERVAAEVEGREAHFAAEVTGAGAVAGATRLTAASGTQLRLPPERGRTEAR
jgi:hypothetical protein